MTTLLIALVVGFVVSVLANVCTTVYLHRALAHRASRWHRPRMGLPGRSPGSRPASGPASGWRSTASTTPSPARRATRTRRSSSGWVKVQIMNVAMYRREAKNPMTVARYAKDIPEDKWDRRLFDHALLGLAIGVAFLVVVFGPVIGLLAAFVHVNLYLGGSAAVNAIGHHFGRRPYDNTAGNLQWLAFITAGEGLHNNHHAVPTSPRLSHRWYEFDPGWWSIRGLCARPGHAARAGPGPHPDRAAPGRVADPRFTRSGHPGPAPGTSRGS